MSKMHQRFITRPNVINIMFMMLRDYVYNLKSFNKTFYLKYFYITNISQFWNYFWNIADFFFSILNGCGLSIVLNVFEIKIFKRPKFMLILYCSVCGLNCHSINKKRWIFTFSHDELKRIRAYGNWSCKVYKIIYC